jgi:hypothetical protein
VPTAARRAEPGAKWRDRVAGRWPWRWATVGLQNGGTARLAQR